MSDYLAFFIVAVLLLAALAPICGGVVWLWIRFFPDAPIPVVIAYLIVMIAAIATATMAITGIQP